MLRAKSFRVRGSVGSSRKRKGAVLVLAALLMVGLMAFLAFCVDLGYMMAVRSELHRATDAAALAGAGALIEGGDQAQLAAFEYLVRNPSGKRLLVEGEGWIDELPTLMAEHEDNFDVEVGYWNPDTRTFTPGDVMPSTVRVVAYHRDVPSFFGRFFRTHERVYNGEGFEDRPVPLDIRSESIARYQPRDIALVLDLSGSMNDDSELKRIGQYGEEVRERVETNLQQIYEELDSPVYGSLQFAPQYLTVVGEPPSHPSLPQITVTFRSDDVYVESTKDLSNVVLQFSDGSTQKIEGLSGTTGAFRGTGSNYYKRIDTVWVKSGQNGSGDCPGCGERFDDDYATIMEAFGLDGVPYPYPSGSWEDYISYVKSSYNVRNAGYRKMYGLMTLINYWLEQKPKASQTPDLWQVSAQPVGSVKDAAVLFLEYLQEVEDIEDRVALAIYDSPDQTALIEHSLTDDFGQVQETMVHRQAAHYDNYTNIGAGIQYAREELEANARNGAFKMIVLLTDGQANRPYGSADEFALEQAQLAADHGWPILTISLGDNADTALMQQIADMTNGAHFNLPGGGTVTDYADQLRNVFRTIADHRPLVLVK